MSDLVGNPENWFSHDMAQITQTIYALMIKMNTPLSMSHLASSRKVSIGLLKCLSGIINKSEIERE